MPWKYFVFQRFCAQWKVFLQNLFQGRDGSTKRCKWSGHLASHNPRGPERVPDFSTKYGRKDLEKNNWAPLRVRLLTFRSAWYLFLTKILALKPCLQLSVAPKIASRASPPDASLVSFPIPGGHFRCSHHRHQEFSPRWFQWQRIDHAMQFSKRMDRGDSRGLFCWEQFYIVNSLT